MYFPRFGLVIIVATITCCLSLSTCRSWWHDPCNIDPTVLCRTKRSDSFRDVRNQIKIFLAHIKPALNKIEYLYRNAQSTKPKELPESFKWLKLKKILWKMKKKPERKLEEFFTGLQLIAGTMVVLKNVNITTASFSKQERVSTYKNLIYQTRSLLCEVDYSLRLRNGTFSEKIILDTMKIPMTRTNFDLDAGRLLDVSFLQKISVFLRRSFKLFSAPDKKRVYKKRNKVVHN